MIREILFDIAHDDDDVLFIWVQALNFLLQLLFLISMLSYHIETIKKVTAIH